MDETLSSNQYRLLYALLFILLTLLSVVDALVCKSFCDNLNSIDQNSLLDLKSNVTNDPLHVFSTWLRGFAISSGGWKGVYCDSSGRVTCIHLSSKSLTGSIPSSLSVLKNLQELHLDSNVFFGSIPPSLGELKNLQSLYLHYNQLSGSIPSSLGGLTNLKYLSLYYNLLSGSIPSSLGGLTNLKYLSLSENQLTGSIPSSLGGLTNLLVLSLNDNQLSGSIPSSLGGLTKLVLLSFDNNYLSESLLVCSGLFKFSFNCLYDSTCDHGTQRSPEECNQFYGRRTGLSNYISTSSKKQSSVFRHSSSYFAFSAGTIFSWTVRLQFNWITEFKFVWPVRNQGLCGSCWAMATVSAVEASFAITTAQPSPPSLSVQQVVDCQPTGNCSGGWPLDALEYISTYGLSSESLYPYISGAAYQSCKTNVVKLVKVSYYEEVKFMGWLGLLLAVQQQPVVVFVEASSPEFVNYRGGILSSDSCLVNGVDHSVVLVGYKIGVSKPYWIIRNSWGSSWGESGYMRLAIKGGSGVCGINTIPGYYPVVKKDNDPCNKVNFGGKYLRENTAGLAGTVNPCGRFQCTVKGTSNICKCEDPFVAAVNVDGSQSCVPKNACNFFTTNPCGVGDCVNGAMGRYSCVCPVGYGIGQYAMDNGTTCVPASLISGPQYYTIPSGAIVSCQVISQNYNLSITQLVAQNKGLQCRSSIPPGTRLNVTNAYIGCSLTYAINFKDTCASIRALFKLTPNLSGPGSPNPHLDCTKLTPGQQVCIKVGPPPGLPVCNLLYSFALDSMGVPKENCSSIIKSKFKGNASQFFFLNPGLYCDRLLNPSIDSWEGTPSEQVCLNTTTVISSTSGCKGKRIVKVGVGHNCGFILKKYFGGKQKAFAKLNRVHCVSRYLFVGRVICI